MKSVRRIRTVMFKYSVPMPVPVSFVFEASRCLFVPYLSQYQHELGLVVVS